MRKLYFIYDSVADSMIYFCEAASDQVAIRSFQYSCENDFKPVAKDLSLYCLGSIVDKSIDPDSVLVYKYKESNHA